MKRINRWLTALLAVLCLLSLVACKKDQTENGGGKHNACGKGEDYVGEGVRHLLESEAHSRAKHGSAANSESSK